MFLIIVVILIIILGGRIFPMYRNYGSVSLGISRLKKDEVSFLEKYFKFYQILPSISKQIFRNRVAYFMHSKEFVPREMIAVSWEMKVLISASAIQLTFGFPNVHLSYFKYILVYPGKFFSLATQTFNQGEVNPMTKSIVLGWKHFVEGYIHADGRNLGLHEMAHALRLENRVMNNEYNFLDKNALREWELRASNTMKEMAEGTETFFREYGATDREEFFAVAVESFFERPNEFANKHPLTYKILANILRQDLRQLMQ